jgi:hypothetical protein
MNDAETQRAVLRELQNLDGSVRSAVKALTGLTDEEIDELGGLP